MIVATGQPSVLQLALGARVGTFCSTPLRGRCVMLCPLQAAALAQSLQDSRTGGRSACFRGGPACSVASQAPIVRPKKGEMHRTLSPGLFGGASLPHSQPVLSLSPVCQLVCFSEPLFTMPLAGSRTVTSPPPCSLLKTFFQLPDGGPLQYYCMPTNTSGDQGLCDKLPLSTGVWPSRPCRSRVAGQDSSIHRWC